MLAGRIGFVFVFEAFDQPDAPCPAGEGLLERTFELVDVL